ncbi:Kynureninase (L-kynurenine hydrolase) [Agyrium rufum]|nr:Kynureninase (L-kynurenine hydrolase) [Agyrium rufum]
MSFESAHRSVAERLDREDPLRQFRTEFIFPTKADLKRKTLVKQAQDENSPDETSVYLCGNSLGLQPRRLRDRINEHLAAWSTKGVHGHFTSHQDSYQPGFLDLDDLAAEWIAPIVGADKSEVACMETLTANLHLLMTSFYRPTQAKYKIILEGKAFPSDHYAIESQLRIRGLDPKSAMVVLEPAGGSSVLSTQQILDAIDEHSSSTAMILLPGIQYYTGQLFDMKTITAHAQLKGLVVGWDLAHAVGNVELELHNWNVDFAAWCNYKYLNAGPGGIAGLFVHERHGKVDVEASSKGDQPYRPRLSGWWGGQKAIRFVMGKDFVPIPGAAGFQVGNPSALALVSLLASLETFRKTDMATIRKKSLQITGYLEYLLDQPPTSSSGSTNPYQIITPHDPAQRGAQLSVLLEPGLLDGVLAELEDNGVVVDERKPDVIRVAPVPLYNSYADIWEFAQIFRTACENVRDGKTKPKIDESVMANGGRDEPGWGTVK